jgi:transcriptional regulator with XRE-family HTH domain
MDFGSWIRSLRQAQDLDIRALTKLTRVEGSTISKVENGQTKLTLLTAIRLCEGLGVTVTDVLTILSGRGVSSGQQEGSTKATSVPIKDDVEQFLTHFHKNREEAELWLSNLLNRAISLSTSAKNRDEVESSQLFGPAAIAMLLLDSPLYQFEIQYPAAITASALATIYQQGGVLSPVDLGEYVRRVRRERQVTLENCPSVSSYVSSRLLSNISKWRMSCCSINFWSRRECCSPCIGMSIVSTTPWCSAMVTRLNKI